MNARIILNPSPAPGASRLPAFACLGLALLPLRLLRASA